MDEARFRQSSTRLAHVSGLRAGIQRSKADGLRALVWPLAGE